MADLAIVEVGPERADEIRELLRVCFDNNPKAEPGIMEWQYWSNPFGRSHTVVALDGTRLVAHHAAYPVPLRLDDHYVTGALQVDTATHPDYRGRGLYGRLSRELYDRCRADGIALMLGNPNAAAYGPLSRVGWRAVDEPRLHVRVTDAAWLARVSGTPAAVARTLTRALFPRRLTGGATAVERVPDGLDELAERAWSRGLAGVRIGTEYWNWRYSDRVDSPYRFFEFRSGGLLEAVTVVRLGTERGETALRVLDLVAVSRRSAQAVLDAAIAATPEAGGVAALATANGPHSRALHWAGFVRVPRRVRAHRSHFGVLPVGDLPVDPLSLTWTLTAGAFDYT